MIEYLVAQYTRKTKHIVAESGNAEKELQETLSLHDFLEQAGKLGWGLASTTECVESGYIDPMLETWIFQRIK